VKMISIMITLGAGAFVFKAIRQKNSGRTFWIETLGVDTLAKEQK